MVAPQVMTVPAGLVERWRWDTPACASRIHLNNAGAALPPQSVVDVMAGHLLREAEIGGYEAAEEAEGRLAEVYEHLARLIGASSREIAVVENATVAFSLALSAFDFQPGDVLVTTRNDYTSNWIMYLALRDRRGLEVLTAEDLPEGGADPESVRELAAHPRCRLVAVSWVPTNSGLVQPVPEIGEVCRELSVPYLVDACQAIGQIPIDVARVGCDFLAVTARKFLRGPRGIGFLYVSEKKLAEGIYPLGVDMRGAHRVGTDGFKLADGARRFENWEFPYALVLGMGEAARYALDAGIERTGERARELGASVREKLSTIPGIQVWDRGPRLCAIATASVAGKDATDLMHRLRKAGINVSVSSSEDGSQTPVLRISPHYYNTSEEIDAAVAAIEELSRG
ncbi:MAG TPA: aminotransferase class V-fold PLP-dependent enzyme [Thermoanaerobaculia bacterium]|nr:aminotransferase class V-fold PLP-dependent enzyme [Thermoanaerobaculia bacterium]